MLKKYQLIKYIQQTIVLTVKGEKVCVDFMGGSTSPVIARGRFATTNRDVQKAIEAHPWFNNEFLLIYAEKDPIKEKLEDVSRKVTDKLGEMTEVKGIRSIQEVKEFLIAKHSDIKEETLNDANKVLMLSERYNYLFPDMVQ